MRSFRRNTAVADLIQRDPTIGLPLFQEPGERVSKKDQALLNAPRALELATPTRNLAHKIITFDPKALAQKQMDVMLAISALTDAYGDATNQEIADWIPRSINRVVGRTFELREMGYVVPSQRRACRSTQEIVQAWKVNPEMKEPGKLPPTALEASASEIPPTMEDFA
jgi:hypothetical protein